MNKNPLHITYNGLIDLVEGKLKQMERYYPGKVLNKEMSAWKANNNIAYYKQLVKMLKAHKKDKQLNLNDLFEQL